MNRGTRLSLLSACLTTVLIAGTASFAERTLVDIIVAQNVKTELQPKLDRLAADLRNDGYTARISPWPAGKSPEDVWNHLKDGYDNDNLQGALLVGHIPLYSVQGSDVDTDLKGTTDNVYWSMTSYTARRPKHIWVSRFYAPANSTYGTEVRLIENALDANHAYRRGASRISHKAYTHTCINRTGEPDACRGHEKGEKWAKNILDTWPETQALYARDIDDVMFHNNADFLIVDCHGNTDRYAEGAITTSKVFSRGCGIRTVIAQSCLTGVLGGVMNAQNITHETSNIISVGYALRAYGVNFSPIAENNTSSLRFRRSIKNGVPWGKAMLRDYPFGVPFADGGAIIYGDLSLPSMMYPEEEDIPAKAGDPSPAPHELSVHPSRTILRWISRAGTKSHDVYFGTDATPDETEFQGNQGETTFDVLTLAQGTTYYWRVDERNEHGITEGWVWRFTTDKDSVPAAASQPAPVDNEAGVCPDTDLHWRAGDEAESFDIYFEAGDSTPDVLVSGNQTDTLFHTGLLEPNTTYFWRVDVRNAFGTTAQGYIWSFTTEKKVPKKLYDINTQASRTENRMAGVGFAIEKPIHITGISVDNLLIGSKDNVGIWRDNEPDSPLHTFSIETGPTKRLVSQPVDIMLPAGSYRMAGLFKEWHWGRANSLDIACAIKELWSVDKKSCTRLSYPDDSGSMYVLGYINFTFVPKDDDIVETVVTSAADRTSPSHVSYANGMILLHTIAPAKDDATVRIVDVRGRTVLKKDVKPLNRTRIRMIPLPAYAHGAYIVTVADGNHVIRGRITVVR